MKRGVLRWRRGWLLWAGPQACWTPATALIACPGFLTSPDKMRLNFVWRWRCVSNVTAFCGMCAGYIVQCAHAATRLARREIKYRQWLLAPPEYTVGWMWPRVSWCRVVYTNWRSKRTREQYQWEINAKYRANYSARSTIPKNPKEERKDNYPNFIVWTLSDIAVIILPAEYWVQSSSLEIERVQEEPCICKLGNTFDFSITYLIVNRIFLHYGFSWWRKQAFEYTVSSCSFGK